MVGGRVDLVQYGEGTNVLGIQLFERLPQAEVPGGKPYW